MAPGDLLDDLFAQDPAAVARRLTDAAADDSRRQRWLNILAGTLDRAPERNVFARIVDVWGLSDAETSRLFGVTRQAIGKWRTTRIPDKRRPAVADLAAVTDLLVHYLKPERIPAVVRRSADMLDGASMLDFVASGRTSELLERTRSMFDLRRLDAA